MSESKKGVNKVVEVTDHLHLSDSVDAILIRNPIRFLTDTIKEKRFIEGVVVSVIYFERFGIIRLKHYFQVSRNPSRANETR